jgi:pyridinium-3,5-bisthiocarboxylic acid mononucleotide nickel chelatase
MKKGRPGTLLTVIAAPNLREALTSTIFRETTTIGVRYREMRRECLDRETITVATPLGTVRFKIAKHNGDVLNASPEFDDCVRLATEHKVPIKHVQAVATQAYLDAKNRGL